MIKTLMGVAVAVASMPLHAQMTPDLSFDINDFGAAVSELRIDVPKGIGSLTPAIALSYNSQAPNGVAGVGWSISGLTSISRCALNNNDSAAGPRSVAYGPQDQFCLDGQRLLLVSGNYGADGAVYRTQLESFNKIVSNGSLGSGAGPQSFTIYTKDGRILQFGATDDSRFIAYPTLSAGVWMINRESDRKSNYIDYLYAKSTSEQIIKTIKYGGNVNQQRATSLQINFTYEDGRTDRPRSWQGGWVIQATKRLKQVATFVGSVNVKNYNLTYTTSPNTSRTLLSNIEECNRNGECRLGLGMQYGSTESPIANALSAVRTSAEKDWGDGVDFIADFQGNGLPIVLTVGGSKIYQDHDTNKSWGQRGDWGEKDFSWVGDFNGDGLPDLASAKSNKVYFKITKSAGGFNAFETTLSTNDWGGGAQRTYVADFNGDGYTDIASIDGGKIILRLNSKFLSFVETNVAVVDNWGRAEYTWVADFNGDGMPDIASAAESGNGIFMKLSTGTGFQSETWNWEGSGGWGDSEHTFIGDFNGDGLADISSSSDDTVHMRISKGKGGFQYDAWIVNIAGDNDWGSGANTTVGDFNGDGLTDIISLDGSNAHMHLSTGHGFNSQDWPISQFFGTPTRVVVADFNGDGRTDIMTGAGNDTIVYYTQGSQDRATKFTDALGARVDWSYARQSGTYNPGKYTSGSPTIVVPSIPLATSIQFDSTTPYSRSVTIGYGDGRFDSLGRGFLGYEYISRYDSSTGITQRTNRRLDWPYIGLIDKRIRTGPQGLSETVTYQYECRLATSMQSACTDLNNAALYIYPEQTLIESPDLGWATLTSIDSIDSYGNPLQVTEKILDSSKDATGYSTVTEYSYTNNAADWLLGSVVRKKVTRTSPNSN